MTKPDTGTAQASPKGDAGQTSRTMLQCLVFCARLKGADLSVDRLVHENSIEQDEVGIDDLALIARRYGFKARVVSPSWKTLVDLGPVYPVVLLLKNGRGVVLTGVGQGDGQRVAQLVDPLADRPGVLELPFERLEAQWSGRALLLKMRVKPAGERGDFGFSWFVTELIKEKKLLSQVLLASLILPIIGLAVPFFFQIVIDRVLVHQSLTTLGILCVGVVTALLFEAAFGLLRQYFLLFSSRRLDIRLAQSTFAHLLSLPLDFFERRYAGVLTKHMQQTEKIRRFFTGRLLLVFLDIFFLFVFLPVLYLYSPKLTLLVLVFTGIIALVVGLLIRPFRKRLRELYAAEGDRQALLVEDIHGIATVKALALEPRFRQKWDNKAALAVGKHYKVGMISNFAQNATKLLQSLMTVAVIAVGAQDVITGALSVGALVAFQMLAGRVSGPLVSVVSLVHEYQETALSIRMLGEIMNAKPERPALKAGLRLDLRGDVTFERVSFTYRGSSLPALSDISFNAGPGSVLGLVGRSGSGKSTLAKLIQGLYTSQEGIIRLDKVDIREIDTAHLRRSIGVVPQESFLFRGTIRENISITKVHASFDEIDRAARMAGADEFIERLPQGFDTFLEEGGVNLSGGQKQRLAIARALITNPRILILDEATSSLDPESEAIIKTNLGRIASDRTVILISHRLTNMVDADSILVLKEGALVCQGTHRELLESCEAYMKMWGQQVGNARGRIAEP
ncbi:MAG: peptidase domain-containing ABC transporter [Desulfarculaceae bacterium]|nr:peptidase domain-containing ABC transporter [Desulfarculaceae bacterium]MCF8074452.1 peptidase domain-containing ABC transporter [Desulfarculaceae bacterium]MCF8102708.1 peptidase domain-containing ABC transporter [Desulfarculaceae bacterium]MCF8116437.1 peptidase domain-containing ABC transporter [Desulfarculaceae bacterium]